MNNNTFTTIINSSPFNFQSTNKDRLNSNRDLFMSFNKTQKPNLYSKSIIKDINSKKNYHKTPHSPNTSSTENITVNISPISDSQKLKHTNTEEFKLFDDWALNEKFKEDQKKNSDVIIDSSQSNNAFQTHSRTSRLSSMYHNVKSSGCGCGSNK